MGIPKFASWIAKKYPSGVFLSQLPGSVATTTPGSGGTTEGASPSLPPPPPPTAAVSALYIDLNGVIHPCCHSEEDASVAQRTEAEKLRSICAALDALVRDQRPTQLLYIAVDGVAPRAKMNQQRTRRYMAAYGRQHGALDMAIREGTDEEPIMHDDDDDDDDVSMMQRRLSEEPGGPNGTGGGRVHTGCIGGSDKGLSYAPATTGFTAAELASADAELEAVRRELLLHPSKGVRLCAVTTTPPGATVAGTISDVPPHLDEASSDDMWIRTPSAMTDAPAPAGGEAVAEEEDDGGEMPRRGAPAEGDTATPSGAPGILLTSPPAGKGLSVPHHPSTTNTTTISSSPLRAAGTTAAPNGAPTSGQTSSPSSPPFDSNCISPGTAFMIRVSDTVREYVSHKLATLPATHPWWHEALTVIMSDVSFPGEGEHKLVDFMRAQGTSSSSPSSHPTTTTDMVSSALPSSAIRLSRGGATPLLPASTAVAPQISGNHVIVGLDADLVLLSLTLHLPNVYILRDMERSAPALLSVVEGGGPVGAAHGSPAGEAEEAGDAEDEDDDAAGGSDDDENDAAAEEDETGGTATDAARGASSSAVAAKSVGKRESPSVAARRSPQPPKQQHDALAGSSGRPASGFPSKGQNAPKASRGASTTVSPSVSPALAPLPSPLAPFPALAAPPVTGGPSSHTPHDRRSPLQPPVSIAGTDHPSHTTSHTTSRWSRQRSKVEFLDVGAFGSFLCAEVTSVSVQIHGPSVFAHLAAHTSNVLNDLCALASFMGNDFLPRLPSAFCGLGALDNIIEVYVHHVVPTQRFITRFDGSMDLEVLQIWLSGYARIESVLMRHAALVRGGGRAVPRRPVGAGAPHPTGGGLCMLPPPHRSWGTIVSGPERIATSAIGGYVDEDIWMRTYQQTTTYRRKSNATTPAADNNIRQGGGCYRGRPQRIDALCDAYIKGIRFVWRYYSTTSKAASWSWCYPAHHAPCACHLADFLKDLLTLSDAEERMKSSPFTVEQIAAYSSEAPLETQPPSPVTQLLCILPPSSRTLLPVALQGMLSQHEAERETTMRRTKEMQLPTGGSTGGDVAATSANGSDYVPARIVGVTTLTDAQWHDNFPRRWLVDITAAGDKEHLAVAQIPFADPRLLGTLVAQCANQFTTEERRRNQNESVDTAGFVLNHSLCRRAYEETEERQQTLLPPPKIDHEPGSVEPGSTRPATMDAAPLARTVPPPPSIKATVRLALDLPLSWGEQGGATGRNGEHFSTQPTAAFPKLLVQVPVTYRTRAYPVAGPSVRLFGGLPQLPREWCNQALASILAAPKRGGPTGGGYSNAAASAVQSFLDVVVLVSVSCGLLAMATAWVDEATWRGGTSSRLPPPHSKANISCTRGANAGGDSATMTTAGWGQWGWTRSDPAESIVPPAAARVVPSSDGAAATAVQEERSTPPSTTTVLRKIISGFLAPIADLANAPALATTSLSLVSDLTASSSLTTECAEGPIAVRQWLAWAAASFRRGLTVLYRVLLRPCLLGSALWALAAAILARPAAPVGHKRSSHPRDSNTNGEFCKRNVPRLGQLDYVCPACSSLNFARQATSCFVCSATFLPESANWASSWPGPFRVRSMLGRQDATCEGRSTGPAPHLMCVFSSRMSADNVESFDPDHVGDRGSKQKLCVID